MPEQLQEQQQRRSMRMSARIGVAAAAAAAAAADSDLEMHMGNESSSTADDHSSDDDRNSGDSGEAAEAEQQSREQAADSTAEEPAANSQLQQRKRRSQHGGTGKTGSKRHKGSSRSGATMPAATPAAPRRGHRRLPVVEQPGGVWRVDGMVRGCQRNSVAVCSPCILRGNAAVYVLQTKLCCTLLWLL
jgi:hypothetical protein